MKYPTRALAYTNEVGVALAPKIGALSTAFWIPALMYFGADIYDKYKQGQEGDYSTPSKRKGVSQATFQALASVLLPTAMIKVGQKIATSVFSQKGKLNFDTQLELLEKVKDTYSSKKGKSPEQVLNEFLESAKKDNADLSKIRIWFQKYLGWFTDDHKVLEKTNKTLKKDAANKQTVIDFIGAAMKKMDERVAANSNKTIKKCADKVFNQLSNKPLFIKIAGGFAALALTVKPIDWVVEQIVIKKGLDPALDKLERTIKQLILGVINSVIKSVINQKIALI